MAKEKTVAPAPSNVIQMTPTSCCVEKCTGKTHKLGFCADHFVWFKEGLVNKKGEKPADFDRKYQAFMMKKKAA